MQTLTITMRVYPGATEVLNGTDDDSDGIVNQVFDAGTDQAFAFGGIIGDRPVVGKW